jgi:hypothetical protein
MGKFIRIELKIVAPLLKRLVKDSRQYFNFRIGRDVGSKHDVTPSQRPNVIGANTRRA